MQIKHFFSFLSVLIVGLLVTPVQGQEENRTISEYEARQQAIDLAQQAEKNLRERERSWRELLAKRDFYQSNLGEKKRSGSTAKRDIKLLKIELDKVEKEVETAADKIKTAKFWAKETRKMITMSKKKRDKELLKYGIRPATATNMAAANRQYEDRSKLSKVEIAEREIAAIRTRERFAKSQPEPAVAAPKKITNPKNVTIEKSRSVAVTEEPWGTSLVTDLPKKMPHSNTDFAQYDAARNTFLNPPVYKCKVEFSGEDRFSGKTRTDLQPEALFYHTDEQLRPYLKNTDYLTADIYLSQLEGGYHFLTLVIRIASKNAQSEYGSIERASVLSFRTLTGKTIKLQANKTERGQYRFQDDSFVYRPQYVISGSAKKALEEQLIDQVRVTWSTGHEDYAVYAVDLIQRQFECLK